jgi:hypothetical protein
MPSIYLVFRIIIAGIDSLDIEAIGSVARTAGIDGFTVSPGIGYHVKWGPETVTVIETCASSAAVETFVSILCTIGAQECAYVTVNGATAALWYADGRKECI